MRRAPKAGFNLVELALVLAVAALALVFFYRSYHDGITRAVARAACTKAADVYAALAESGLLRDGLPDGCATNSTAFFQAAIASGRCPGLTNDALVAGGVPASRGGALAASNNIWTVAVNLPDEAPGSLPVLLSRNVDLAPLASGSWRAVAKRPVAYDAEWGSPFHAWGFVCVRKSGALLIYRSARVTYGELFPDGPPRGAAGPSARPLTYLTPAGAVAPASGE